MEYYLKEKKEEGTKIPEFYWLLLVGLIIVILKYLPEIIEWWNTPMPS